MHLNNPLVFKNVNGPVAHYATALVSLVVVTLLTDLPRLPSTHVVWWTWLDPFWYIDLLCSGGKRVHRCNLCTSFILSKTSIQKNERISHSANLGDVSVVIAFTALATAFQWVKLDCMIKKKLNKKQICWGCLINHVLTH